MKIEITVSGLKEVQSGIQKINSGLKDTSELVYDAGLLIEAQAKKNATGRPGPNVITGNLRASIVTSLSSPIQSIVGVGVSYAPYVEFGHAQILDKVSKKGRPYGRFVGKIGKVLINPRAPAYPFFFKAIEQSANALKQLVQDWIRKLL